MLFDLAGNQIDADDLTFDAITQEGEEIMSAFVLGCVLTWIKVKRETGCEEDFSVKELFSCRDWETIPLQQLFNNPAYADMSKDKRRENVQMDAGKLLKKVLTNYEYENFEYCKHKGDYDNHWSNSYRLKRQEKE